MTRRASAVLLFSLGAAAVVAAGCVLAAYDLWGGVPRPLWRLVRGLLLAALTLMLIGGARWFTSFPVGQRLRAALRAALVLSGLAAVLGGGLVAYYLARWQPSRRICAPARLLPSLAARHEALARGVGPLFPVIDPNPACITLKHELDELATRRTCPLVPPAEARCRCGTDTWTGPQSGPACATGPTTCEWRPERQADALGCAGPTSERARREAAE